MSETQIRNYAKEKGFHPQTLERWLSDPDLVVKDNNMSFGVPKAEERRDLIAYLKQ